nr:glycosyltransferase [Acinetobacter baumannii]
MLVSVVLPAYNAELYLKEAIESVIAKRFADFELIVINDGSVDKTEHSQLIL